MHEVACGNAFSERPLNTDNRIMRTLACPLVHVCINRAPLQRIIKRKVAKLHTMVAYSPGVLIIIIILLLFSLLSLSLLYVIIIIIITIKSIDFGYAHTARDKFSKG